MGRDDQHALFFLANAPRGLSLNCNMWPESERWLGLSALVSKNLIKKHPNIIWTIPSVSQTYSLQSSSPFNSSYFWQNVSPSATWKDEACDCYLSAILDWGCFCSSWHNLRCGWLETEQATCPNIPRSFSCIKFFKRIILLFSCRQIPPDGVIISLSGFCHDGYKQITNMSACLIICPWSSVSSSLNSKW